MARDGYEADLNRLCIYSLETGKKHYLNWKSDVEAFCWAPANGKKMKVTDPQFYFLSVWHGCCNMYMANQKGEVTQLTETWDDWTSIQMANNGQRILATRQSPQLFNPYNPIDIGSSPVLCSVGEGYYGSRQKWC